MKKIRSVFLFGCILFIICACTHHGGRISVGGGFEASRTQDIYDGFLETPYGEYQLVNIWGDGGVIYYAEPGTHDFYLLCGKPECTHRTEDCNACGGIAFGYYNERLYYVRVDAQGDLYLSVMKMDGTDHSDVIKLPEIEDPVSGASSAGGEYCFHNGYLYMTCLDDLTETVPRTKLYRIGLTSGEVSLLFEPFFETYISVGFHLFDDRIYMKVLDRAEAFVNGPTGRESICRLAAGNVTTNQMDMLFEHWPYFGGILPVEKDGKLYYHRPDIGYCEYDLALGVEKVRQPADLYLSQVSYGEDFIFARELENAALDDDDWVTATAPWQFTVYDYNYNVVSVLPWNDLVFKPEFLFASNDCLYFSDASDHKITCFALLSEIGTDLFKLHYAGGR